MTDDRSHAYAEALLAVARSEGQLAEVEDELFRFARLLEANDDLRTTLTDASLPVSRRQQIVAITARCCARRDWPVNIGEAIRTRKCVSPPSR